MGYGMWGGLGDGLMQIGSRMYDDDARKEDEKSYMRKLEAAEKARDAREAADRARQAELDKSTPVKRRTFLGSADQGPPAIKYEAVNKYGEPVASGNASEGEASEFRGGLLGAADSRREAEAKAAFEREKFDRTEAGRDRRASMTDKRIRDMPRGSASAAKPTTLHLQKDATGDLIGYDRVTGEAKTKNGKPIGKSGGSLFSRSEDGSYVFE